jgi:hypothetical protein
MRPGLRRKSFFAATSAKKIAAVEREERSTPRFFCPPKGKKCAKPINLTEKKYLLFPWIGSWVREQISQNCVYCMYAKATVPREKHEGA